MQELQLKSPAVVGSSLVLRYGPTIAVSTSDFVVPAGGVTVLIGPNGSGKSTLLNAMAGLHQPSEGSIAVAPANGRSARIAYVLQAAKINEALPVTVGEVVRMGRYATTGAYGRLGRADHDAVREAMDRIAVSDLADRHLHELSSGQRQRVFVAQALAQDHDLLLLDEPLTGLDLPSARAIDAVIHNEQAQGRTVVITTHDLAEAQVADHVLLLSGRVVADGPPPDVLNHRNLTEAYGPSLLHIDGKGWLIDDPAHRPVEGRHSHQDRSIHVEPSTTDRHPD